jgi:hypothetical protein
MNWLAIPTQKAGKTQCGITGSAALIFGPDANGRERHGFALPYLVFDPLSVARLVLSNPANDLIFNLIIDREKIVGSVFSKRYGWLGTLAATKDVIPPPSARYVPILTGDYVRKEVPNLPLHLDAEVGPAQGETYDPITGMDITGWLTLYTGTETTLPGEVENAFFDYFVNYLFIRTTNQLFVGKARADGLMLSPISRIFLGTTARVGPLPQFWKRQ